jgi:uncharacterized protein (DUF433 family)
VRRCAGKSLSIIERDDLEEKQAYHMERKPHPRIERDPEVMNGKPVIRGTRFPVDLLLERLAFGHPIAEVLDDYPFLTAEDIYAALEYAAEAVRNEVEHEPTPS